jgi:hypothetical protein
MSEISACRRRALTPFDKLRVVVRVAVHPDLVGPTGEHCTVFMQCSG